MCSGTIVDKIYIVTVSKCINKIPNGSRIEVNAPSDDGEGVFINVPKQSRLVSDIFTKTYTDYSDVDVKNDEIAILRLSHPLNFSNNIQPISIPAKMPKIIPEGTIVYFYGFTELRKRGMTFNAMTVRFYCFFY